MKRIHLYITITFLSLSVWGVRAQQDYASQISVSRQTIEKVGNEIKLFAQLDFSQLKLNTQHLLVVTPVLKSNSGEQTLRLAPVAVSGKVRSKVLSRNSAKRTHELYGSEPFASIRRVNGTTQVIDYRGQVPMEDWMKNARLLLDVTTTGCADCGVQQFENLLAERIFAEPYKPVYKLTYIVPEVERVKKRCEECVAYLNYKVSRAEILPELGNNEQELNMVNKTIREAKSDKNITITDLSISGYASPEGNHASNLLLSERRAQALAKYITNRFGIAENDMKIKWYGEDWDGLAKAVKTSNLTDKEAVLNIINTVANPDARDTELKKLSRGETYKTLLHNYYPPLRRNEYRINYVARAFDVEEAKLVLKINPKLLSLNEMYLLAHSYAPESKAFKEVFDIAARLYPDSEIAILNSAAADIENGNNQAAIDRMSRIKDNPKAWNNLGVAYARLGDEALAKEFLDKAADNGDADAKHNVATLQRVEDEQ